MKKTHASMCSKWLGIVKIRVDWIFTAGSSSFNKMKSKNNLKFDDLSVIFKGIYLWVDIISLNLARALLI
ncbi:hypothetical protein GF373_08780 [bacterium]|nr:hypothetical protein [bacterium]